MPPSRAAQQLGAGTSGPALVARPQVAAVPPSTAAQQLGAGAPGLASVVCPQQTVVSPSSPSHTHVAVYDSWVCMIGMDLNQLQAVVGYSTTACTATTNR